MARITRSKRVNISEDQSAVSTLDVSPTELFYDKPLSEIPSSNTMAPMQDTLAAEVKGLKAAYRTAIGAGRKGAKRGRKQKKIQELDTEGNEDDLDLEAPPALDVHSVPSSIAVHQSAGTQQGEGNSDDPANGALIPERRTTRRQAAKAQAEQELSKSAVEVAKDAQDSNSSRAFGDPPVSEELNVKEILPMPAKTFAEQPYTAERSPSKSPVKTLDDVEKEAPCEDPTSAQIEGDDSFVELIIARSPAKPVTRIEDSVEALDQLEEALEALDAATLAEKLVSPEKTRQKTPNPPDYMMPLECKTLLDRTRTATETLSRSSSIRNQSAKPGFSSMRVKPTVPKAPAVRKVTSMTFRAATPSEAIMEKSQVQSQPKLTSNRRPMSMIVKSTETGFQSEAPKKTIRRPISSLLPKETIRSSKPVTQAAFELPGEAVARRLKEQREARLARREASEDSAQPSRTVSGPKIKSTKPLTVSNFELPGEALSRRKREAYEAKLKAQEEEERKRREFKAKPLPKNVATNTTPRDTVASRARQSRIGLENMIEVGILKRNSVMSSIGAHRPSLAALTSANTSAPRAPGPSPQLIRKPSATSASGINMSGKAMQRTVSASDVQVQRQRAREIYNRDAKLTEEIERERREREAAAKKAREEAAERGRQASREWAEKQLAKKLAEGKGMNASSIVGGQVEQEV